MTSVKTPPSATTSRPNDQNWFASVSASVGAQCVGQQGLPAHDFTGYMGTVRRPFEDRLTEPVRFLAGTPTLERYRSSKLVTLRSFRATASLVHGALDEGVLFATETRAVATWSIWKVDACDSRTTSTATARSRCRTAQCRSTRGNPRRSGRCGLPMEPRGARRWRRAGATRWPL